MVTARVRRGWWRAAHRSRTGYLLLCTALFVAKPSAAQVDVAALDLAWSAPPECPDREAVLEILRARLPVRRAATDLRVRAQVVRKGAEYQLTVALESRGTQASRRLMQRRCAPLAEAAAVLIALAMESEAGSAVSEAQGADPAAEQAATRTPEEPQFPREDVTPAPQSPAQSVSAPATTSTSPPSSRRRAPAPELLEAFPESPGIRASSSVALHLQLSAAVRGGLGTFPEQPALGMQAQLAFRIRALSMALGATYWPAREHSSITYPSARLRGSGLFSDVGLGWDLTMLPFVVTPLLNLELGQLSAQANGIEGPELNRALWLAAGAGVAIALNLSDDWVVALELSALVPISRTRWLVRTPDGDALAFVAAPLTPRLSLRIGYVLR